MLYRVRGNSKTSGVTSSPTPFAKIYVHSKIWFQQCVLQAIEELTRHKIAGIRVIKQSKGTYATSSQTAYIYLDVLHKPSKTCTLVKHVWYGWCVSIMYEMHPTAAACTDGKLYKSSRYGSKIHTSKASRIQYLYK